MKRLLIAPCALLAGILIAVIAIARPVPILELDVPMVVRGVDRSAPAALAMVLGFYGADSSVQKRVDDALGSRTGNASPKELAATASRLGYSARITSPGVDSLVEFLRAGVPPIVCVEPAPGKPGRIRYYVVTRWDTISTRFYVRDGGPRVRPLVASLLQSVWEPGGGRAIIVTRRGAQR